MPDSTQCAPTGAPKKLPNTLHGLLTVAVKDAQKIEITPGYTMNMRVWHERSLGSCQVCVAGAVMACTLGVPRDQTATASSSTFGDNGVKLRAIDYLRMGDTDQAWETLQLGPGSIAVRFTEDLPAGKQQALKRASKLIRENYQEEAGRAPWFIYQQAAEILKAARL
jgi:hypothetical protein